MSAEYLHRLIHGSTLLCDPPRRTKSPPNPKLQAILEECRLKLENEQYESMLPFYPLPSTSTRLPPTTLQSIQSRQINMILNILFSAIGVFAAIYWALRSHYSLEWSILMAFLGAILLILAEVILFFQVLFKDTPLG